MEPERQHVASDLVQQSGNGVSIGFSVILVHRRVAVTFLNAYGRTGAAATKAAIDNPQSAILRPVPIIAHGA